MALFPQDHLRVQIDDEGARIVDSVSGVSVDLTTHLLHLQIELSEQGKFASFAVRAPLDADIELDRLLHRTSTVAGPEILKRTSPEKLNEVLANAGYTDLGQAVFEHLQSLAN